MGNDKILYSVFGLNILSKDLKLPELKISKNSNHEIEIVKLNDKIPYEIDKYNCKYKNLFINKKELLLHV